MKVCIDQVADEHGRVILRHLNSREVGLVQDSLAQLQNHLFIHGDAKLAIVDSGACCWASCNKSDFSQGTLQVLDQPVPMDGVAGQLKATHTGIVRYEVLNQQGSVSVLEAKAYYVPDLTCRLLSPQDYMRQQREQEMLRQCLQIY